MGIMRRFLEREFPLEDHLFLLYLYLESLILVFEVSICLNPNSGPTRRIDRYSRTSSKNSRYLKSKE